MHNAGAKPFPANGNPAAVDAWAKQLPQPPSRFNASVGGMAVQMADSTERRVYDLFQNFQTRTLQYLGYRDNQMSQFGLTVNFSQQQVTIFEVDEHNVPIKDANGNLVVCYKFHINDLRSEEGHRLQDLCADIEHVMVCKGLFFESGQTNIGRHYHTRYKYANSPYVGKNGFANVYNMVRTGDETKVALSDAYHYKPLSENLVNKVMGPGLSAGDKARVRADTDRRFATAMNTVNGLIKGLKAKKAQVAQRLQAALSPLVIAQKQQDLARLDKEIGKLQDIINKQGIVYLSLTLRVAGEELGVTFGNKVSQADWVRARVLETFKDNKMIGHLVTDKKAKTQTRKMTKAHFDLATMITATALFGESESYKGASHIDNHAFNRSQKEAFTNFCSKHGAHGQHAGRIGALMRLDTDRDPDAYELNMQALCPYYQAGSLSSGSRRGGRSGSRRGPEGGPTRPGQQSAQGKANGRRRGRHHIGKGWNPVLTPVGEGPARYEQRPHRADDRGSEADDSDLEGHSSDEGYRVSRRRSKGAGLGELGRSRPASFASEDLGDGNGGRRRYARVHGRARMNSEASDGRLSGDDEASIGSRQRRGRNGADADLTAARPDVVGDLGGASSTKRRRTAAGKGIDRSNPYTMADMRRDRINKAKAQLQAEDAAGVVRSRHHKHKKSAKATFGPNDFSAGERSDGSVD